MSKAAIETRNYFTRSANHSMTGSRRGFGNILPKSADGWFGSDGSLYEQRDGLRNEIQALRTLSKKRRLTSQEKRRLNNCNSMLGNIQKTLCLISCSAYDETKAWIFWRLASHKLKHELFRTLDKEAEEIVNNAIMGHTP